MKNILIILAPIIIILVIATGITKAQMMQDGAVTNIPATSEELEGKAIWDNLKAGQIICGNLVDNDFELLGEYFMGGMMGVSHEAMNDRLKQTIGETGERQIHIVIGKRMSGCDTTAAYPAGFYGFTPMMGSVTMGNNSINNMMGFGYGYNWFGWFLMIVWWALVIISLILVIRRIANPSNIIHSRSAINILKERYAKGEIEKKEFEEKKKELQQ